MNKLPERIRIKDIARLADVSVGTVDRVIHGRSGVSEASKKRVEEILKQLDYQPNMYASALASNKKYTSAAGASGRRILDSGRNRYPRSYCHLFGFQYFGENQLLRSVRLPFIRECQRSHSGFTAGRSDGSSYRSAVYERFHRSVAGIGYTLYIYRLQYQRRSSPRLLWSELTPKRILRCQNDDVTGTG